MKSNSNRKYAWHLIKLLKLGMVFNQIAAYGMNSAVQPELTQSGLSQSAGPSEAHSQPLTRSFTYPSIDITSPQWLILSRLDQNIWVQYASTPQRDIIQSKIVFGVRENALWYSSLCLDSSPTHRKQMLISNPDILIFLTK
jgi:hypothetical protein